MRKRDRVWVEIVACYELYHRKQKTEVVVITIDSSSCAQIYPYGTGHWKQNTRSNRLHRNFGFFFKPPLLSISTTFSINIYISVNFEPKFPHRFVVVVVIKSSSASRSDGIAEECY